MELIVSFFDLSLEQMINEVENASKSGAKWILLPPQQHHFDYDSEWWSSYLPLGYYIQDDVKELVKKFVDECNKYDIKVMLDTVMNHTDGKIYKKGPRYHDKNHKELTKKWLYDSLPDLNTNNKSIMNEGYKFIQECRNMGIQGFRFDAAPFVNHEFFDYILKDSPEYELHIYEVLGFSLEFTNEFLKRRINFRENNTYLYDFQEYYNSNRLIKQETITNYDSFYYDTLLPNYGVSVITNHDQILHNWDITPIDMLSAGILTTFMSCHKYILTVVCSSNAIPTCSIWSWETIQRFILPIIKVKNEIGNVPATLQTKESILIAKHGNDFVLSFNRNYSKDNTKSHSKPPIDYLLKTDIGLANEIYVNILTSKYLEDIKIPIPQRTFVILKRKNILVDNKANNIHLFWYQGWDEIPTFVTKSLNQWSKLSESLNYNLILWDKKSIENLDLNCQEKYVLNKIESNFPTPEKYAAYSDIARLIVLYKFGGIYVDTDAYVTNTTSDFVKWTNSNNNSLVIGIEPNGMVNNAIILCSYDSRYIINKIFNEIYNDLKLKLDTNVLNFAGPQRLTQVVKKLKWYELTILPVNWLYSTWGVNKDGLSEKCTKELVLVQHCYAGSWFTKNSKYRYDGYYYHHKKLTKTNKNKNLYKIILFLLIIILIQRLKNIFKINV